MPNLICCQLQSTFNREFPEKTLILDDLERRCTDHCATPPKLLVNNTLPQSLIQRLWQRNYRKNRLPRTPKRICPAHLPKQKDFFLSCSIVGGLKRHLYHFNQCSLPQDPSRAQTATRATIVQYWPSSYHGNKDHVKGRNARRPPHLHKPCLCTGQEHFFFFSSLDICKGLLTSPPQDSGDSKETGLIPLQA